MALLASVLWTLPAIAQSDVQLTQYWATPTYYNPAAAGNLDSIHVTIGSRLQWVGVKHAPITLLAMGDMPFKFLEKRWGTGVVLQQESMGLYRSTNVYAQLAHKRKMLKGMLSLGVQVGLVNQTFKGTDRFIPEDKAHDSNDDAIPNVDVAGSAFDLSAGLFYQHKYFWVGASATHLTQPSVTLKQGENEEQQYEFIVGRNYYFMAGGNIPIKNTLLEVMPSVFFKTDFNFYQVEATARVRYNKFLSGGVAYRHNDAVSAMLGVNFKNFFVGYAYDYPISALSKVTTGSHEVFLNYNIKLDMSEKNRNRHKSIRIM